MDKFSFWQKWLFFVSLYLIIFGIFFTIFNQTHAFNLLFNDKINPCFWDAKSITPEIINFQKWIYGVLGAVIVGWGIFMAFLAYYPFAKKEKWSWNCMALGLLVWYISDTAISLVFNVYFNAMPNTIILILFALPLIFTRKYFK